MIKQIDYIFTIFVLYASLMRSIAIDDVWQKSREAKMIILLL
jgi:hypothetical protein